MVPRMPATAPDTFECMDCGEQMAGWTKRELISDHDWRWYTIDKARSFVMCGGCVKRYEPIWEARARVAA